MTQLACFKHLSNLLFTNALVLFVIIVYFLFCSFSIWYFPFSLYKCRKKSFNFFYKFKVFQVFFELKFCQHFFFLLSLLNFFVCFFVYVVSLCLFTFDFTFVCVWSSFLLHMFCMLVIVNCLLCVSFFFQTLYFSHYIFFVWWKRGKTSELFFHRKCL